ncbi:lactaldehyde dehydrogenase / glycolaldehyde dehydrogenase [Cupriavidus metallidurans]|jgi:lactaldehyde dehydrogenase / glycolaldehyde dehydrogenase|uniref:aldehyde dehydrogenase family protein n=1 Tax=Cupriavidus metallidurans TaxID=119219 RepID=UPI0004936CD3|nr:aldehyde dehydrogenase family protein [Cupriavidus metallidurans]KWW39418.1 Lactaldehyde dehydrogenase [Cupriavidus metallidurans]MDE4920633.1 aldehyde dehydrogenase family protein [Cupriavidus metallidurans]
MKVYRNYVGKFLIPTDGREKLDVHSPATGEIVATVDIASMADADLALEKARAAQRGWRKLPAVERGRYLQRLADSLVAHIEDISHALARESGKSVQHGRDEVKKAAEITRYHAQWARRISGEVIQSDNADENILLMREPLGVVVCLIPFNSPVFTLMRKIAPALIAGNSVIVRPSDFTPCSALEVATAVAAAGIPDGLVNILAMDHAGAERICTHPTVGMISLTGSVRAGQKMLDYARSNMAKVSLELGGKTPAIVTDGANLRSAATGIARSKTTNCGQLCTAVSRVYVQRNVATEFIALLKEQLLATRWGDRSVNPDWMGPLIHEQARTHLHAMVERAVQDGAVLECGGFVPDGKGYFYPPTLLTGCHQGMEIVQEETFGPVLCVVVYESLDEAIFMANDHQYGLASIVFSEDYRTLMRVANEIEAGECYVNRIPADPFQGHHAGWKMSGCGGDDGQHGMLAFTQTRLVVMPFSN